MADEPVRIALTRDEALVLHEFLARAVDDENGAPLKGAVEHDAELWALNAVLVVLEGATTEPFEAGFEKAPAAARKRLVAASGPWPWDAG